MNLLTLTALLTVASGLPNEASVSPASAPATPVQEMPQPERAVSQEPVTCPPGQFASAFSDVYPTDWAYEAVNRLAHVEIQCFSWPNSGESDVRH